MIKTIKKDKIAPPRHDNNRNDKKDKNPPPPKPNEDHRYDKDGKNPPPPPRDDDRRDRDDDKDYDKGDIATAVVVGGVVGAIIANNT